MSDSRLTTIPKDVFISERPILWQAWLHFTELSKTQILPTGIMALIAFIAALITGQVTSLGSAFLFVVLSVVVGLIFYALLAIARAPFVIISQQHRQISELNQRLSEVESRTFDPASFLSAALLPAQTPNEQLSDTRGNSFSDFRVISEEPSRLEFEVWYFYDGALGGDDICISATLENDGVAVTSVREEYEKAFVVRHKALQRMALSCRPTQGESSFNSTHIVLAMVLDKTESVFYRQLIPYEKVWKIS